MKAVVRLLAKTRTDASGESESDENPVDGSLKKSPRQLDRESDGKRGWYKNLRKPTRKELSKRKRKKLEASFRKELEEERLKCRKKRGESLIPKRWLILLKKTKEDGLFDVFITWVCENRDIVTLSQVRELFEALIDEEDMKTAGIACIHRGHESEGRLARAIKRVIQEYAKENEAELLKNLDVALHASDKKQLNRIIVAMSQLLCLEHGKKAVKTTSKAAEALHEIRVEKKEDSGQVLIDFANELKSERNKKEHWFEPKWNLPKSYFMRLLEIVYAYSKKLEEETHRFIPYEVDEDLAEILRLAIATYAPGVETTLCDMLRKAVETEDENILKDLLVLLSHIIIEADTEKQDRPSEEKLEGEALSRLRLILNEQNGDIPNETLLASFARIACGKVEDVMFEKLSNVAQALDESYGYYRLAVVKPCVGMLKEWSFYYYEIDAGDKLYGERDGIQRLTGFSHQQIYSLKEPEVKRGYLAEKIIFNVADTKQLRIANRGKIFQCTIEGMTAMGIDIDISKILANDLVVKEEQVVPEPTGTRSRFGERKKPSGLAAEVNEGKEEADMLSELSKRRKERILQSSQYAELCEGLPQWLIQTDFGAARQTIKPLRPLSGIAEKPRVPDIEASPTTSGISESDLAGGSANELFSSSLDRNEAPAVRGDTKPTKSPRLVGPPRKALPTPESYASSHSGNASRIDDSEAVVNSSQGEDFEGSTQIEKRRAATDARHRRGVTLNPDNLRQALEKAPEDEVELHGMDWSHILKPEVRNSGTSEANSFDDADTE